MRASDQKPVLAIVGRPNVGKSALFNRIVRRRLAIVHEEVGVTRDRLSVDARWNDRTFRLMDTGGIRTVDGGNADEGIDGAVCTQALAAVDEADAMIHVVDVIAGLTPLDIEVGRILRLSGRPVLVAANKADNDSLAEQAVDFAPLGRDTFPVSALHNRGIGDLMEAAVNALPESAMRAAPESPQIDPLRIVVVGRPNAGKSSFINALLGQERVIVSSTPGTTRDSIEIPFTIGAGEQARPYLLCDTAGLRPKGKRREAVEHFSHLRVEDAVRRADIAALMFDATSGPSRQDKRIAALIQAERKGCVLMVNKWDLAEGMREAPYAQAVREAMPFLNYAPLVFLSAKTGYRVRATIGAIDRVAAAYGQTVTTGVLNRALHAAFERTHPPVIRGRPLKFFYAAQIGARPPRFRLFVNDPQRLTDTYRAYLEGRLRKALGFEGAPVILSFSGRARS